MGWLYTTYHPLQEPETSVECLGCMGQVFFFQTWSIWRRTIKLQDGKIDVNEGVLHKLLHMRDA